MNTDKKTLCFGLINMESVTLLCKISLIIIYKMKV